jgi:2-haloacid dehalogenase
MIKVLFFDAFRTLFDTFKTHTEATRLILEHEKLDVDFNEFHDKWDERIMERWRADEPFRLLWPIFEDCLIDTFEYCGAKNYDAAAGIKMWLDLVASAPPFPETVAVVEPLSRQYKTAIVSNSDNFEMKLCLERLGLNFDAVFTSEDVRSYKPRVEIFQAALAHFDASPDEAVMIGDSLSADVEGARNAGLKSIWINRTGKEIPPGKPRPDFTLPDLKGLPEILAAM